MAIEELCTCYNFPPKLDSHFIHSLLHRPVFKDRDGTFSSPSTFCLLFIRKPATYRPTTRTCLCNLQRPRNQPSHMLLVFRPESSSRCNAHHSYTIIITSTSIILSAVLRRVVVEVHQRFQPYTRTMCVCCLSATQRGRQAIPNRKCTTTWG